MTKRIVIDGRFWSESGIGRYIKNLVEELQELDKANEYFILHLQKDYDNLVYHSKNFHKVLADFKWYGIKEQYSLLKVLKELKPDLAHFPHFNVPLFYKGKFIVTIHDLIHQHFQTRQATTRNPLIYGFKKAGYRLVFSHAIRKAQKIITPSEFVKRQLKEEWEIVEGKISVTPEGVDEKITRLAKEVSEREFHVIAEKFQIQKPYIFYIGNAQPHKNILRLIRVLGLLKKRYHNLQLVLAGPPHYFWEKIKAELGEIGGLEVSEKGVIFTVFVSDKDMVVLYKNALAYIQPSLEEGFGIPILEAMACGCPVISSSAASLPEVGGDAVLYFDPKDEEDMFTKISLVLGDERLRKELIKKGEKRYKEFSWAKMAKQTLKVYQDALG